MTFRASPRFSAARRGAWWSVWDTYKGAFADDRRWLSSMYASTAASHLNKQHDKEQ